MRDALGLEVAALYLPTGNGPTLGRLGGHRRRPRAPPERLVFDVEAWQLAVQGDTPLVMRDRGEWLMEHPFDAAGRHLARAAARHRRRGSAW